ncbi:hypothetical protein KY331_02335 [Candidatus Woesearchaeota archaeon]|nr:hypothetical protein [Candidatus Woesearchaeota archaeon]
MANGLFSFGRLFESLEYLGLMDVLLPFLLIFTLVFAVLQKTHILGKGRKNFNVIIALIVGFSVVIPHVMGTYPAGFDVVNIINVMLPQVSLILVAILMLLLLIGIFAGASTIPSWIALICFVLILFIFIGSTEWLYGLDWLYEIFGTETISLIIILLVFGIIVWFITAESKGEKVTGTLDRWLGELFKR